jgi:predicted phosphodiesterase
MRIVILGDTHGNNVWKGIVDHEKDSTDLFIFLGDYFDSRNPKISQRDCLNNFNDILQFKNLNKDKVVLLIGNHDYHWLPDAPYKQSSFDPYMDKEIGDLLTNNINNGNIQLVYEQDNYLFSHAGISQKWLEHRKLPFDCDIINDIIKKDKKLLAFHMGDDSEDGEHPLQSPIWIRPDTLSKCILPGYIHVVGHTKQEEINISDSLILCDTLNGSNCQYLIIDNNKIIIGVKNKYSVNDEVYTITSLDEIIKGRVKIISEGFDYLIESDSYPYEALRKENLVYDKVDDLIKYIYDNKIDIKNVHDFL